MNVSEQLNNLDPAVAEVVPYVIGGAGCLLALVVARLGLKLSWRLAKKAYAGAGTLYARATKEAAPPDPHSPEGVALRYAALMDPGDDAQWKYNDMTAVRVTPQGTVWVVPDAGWRERVEVRTNEETEVAYIPQDVARSRDLCRAVKALGVRLQARRAAEKLAKAARIADAGDPAPMPAPAAGVKKEKKDSSPTATGWYAQYAYAQHGHQTFPNCDDLEFDPAGSVHPTLRAAGMVAHKLRARIAAGESVVSCALRKGDDSLLTWNVVNGRAIIDCLSVRTNLCGTANGAWLAALPGEEPRFTARTLDDLQSQLGRYGGPAVYDVSVRIFDDNGSVVVQYLVGQLGG